METYLASQRHQALQILRRVYGYRPGRREDPIFVLISEALQEDRGSISSPPSVGEPTSKQWEIWGILRDRRPKLLLWALKRVMVRENGHIPDTQYPEELAEWAVATLVLALDEIPLSRPLL